MMVSLRRRGWFLGGLASLVLLGFCSALLSGCSGCDRTGSSTTKTGKEVKTDYLAAARDLYRKAGEAASFRDANEQVNKHLEQQPDALAKIQAAKEPATVKRLLAARGVDAAKLDDLAAYLKLLETAVGLDKGELEEVGSANFRLLDAYYLESCFLLREISRSMPLEGLTPLERAEFCFRWVMRQVVLEEVRDEMLPPQYVLKRGEGSSRERAFVWFALLQQLDLDVCVIAVPDQSGGPRPWLAGVLIPSGDKTDIYLFDARLGLPLAGPKGQGIATLTQLKADPHLLDHFKTGVDGLGYDVDAGQLAGSEIWLIVPLSALSARMRFLQEGVLEDFDRITLAVRLPELMEKCESLKAGPVRVWRSGPAVQTPTNALRLFLPPEEGGTDASKSGLEKLNRLQSFEVQRTPRAVFLQAFLEDKSLPLEVPSAANQIQGIVQQVWQKYALEPAQQLLRGRLDNVRRLVRAQTLVNEVEAFLVLPGGMAAEVEQWKKMVLERARQGRHQEVFAEDPWLAQVVGDPDDNQAVKGFGPKTLSYVVLRAVYKPLQYQTDYLLVQRWREKAERLQVQLQLLAGGSAGDAERARLRDKAKEAWQAAVSYGEAPGLAAALTPATWKTALDAAAGLAPTSSAPLSVDLVEFQVQWIRKAAAVRLQQAAALERSGKRGQAASVLEKLQSDVDLLEKRVTRDNLRATIVQPAAPTLREELGKGIDRLAADCGPRGSLWWMRYAAAVRHKQGKEK
jgi:hypothetical protein